MDWAREEEPVRAVVLVGSRAGARPSDELADWDVAVFTRSLEPYVREDRWLSSIGEVWVSVPDRYEVAGETIPTRLVVFEGGVKVDFAFHSLSLLASVEWTGPFRVVLDKDGIATGLERSTESPPAPTEEDFVRIVREFWFEAYHVAKYLHRNELWLVKSRDWATKELLLRMLEWRAQHSVPGFAGAGIEQWVDRTSWHELHDVFAPFDEGSSRRALHATLRMFRRLGVETATQHGYRYPREVDEKMSSFIERIAPSDAPPQ